MAKEVAFIIPVREYHTPPMGYVAAVQYANTFTAAWEIIIVSQHHRNNV